MITEEQIQQLGFEAGAHGDYTMAQICQEALAGSPEAQAQAQAAILDAQAQL